MHICFITNEYPKEGFPHGGVGTFIKTIGNSLVSAGFKVTVLGINSYTAAEECSDDNGITIIRLKPKKIKGFNWYFNSLLINRELKKINKNLPIDVVETAESGLALLKKIYGVSYVIRMHGGHHFFSKYENRPVKWRHAYLEKKSFKKADALIAVSDFVGRETLDLLGLKNRTYTVVYNPIDFVKFQANSDQKKQEYSIFFAGSIVEKKGIRQLVESLNYLVEEYPEIKLYIAGRDANIPGTDKPYRPILNKSITSKIASHIDFLGVVPHNQIPNLIMRSQICCYPSHMEAMPLAWLEVMAIGNILVGGDIGPGREIIENGMTGFLVDPKSPEAIAAKIKYVFENYDNCSAIAKRGQQKIKEEFDINVILEENIKAYKKIKNRQRVKIN